MRSSEWPNAPAALNLFEQEVGQIHQTVSTHRRREIFSSCPGNRIRIPSPQVQPVTQAQYELLRRLEFENEIGTRSRTSIRQYFNFVVQKTSSMLCVNRFIGAGNGVITALQYCRLRFYCSQYNTTIFCVFAVAQIGFLAPRVINRNGLP